MTVRSAHRDRAKGRRVSGRRLHVWTRGRPRRSVAPGGRADLVTDSLPGAPDGSPDDEHAVAAGALLLRLDVALPMLAAAVVNVPAAVPVRVGRQERPDAPYGPWRHLDGNPVVTMAAGRTAPGPPTCRHMRCWRCEPLPNQQRARGSNPVTGAPRG